MQYVNGIGINTPMMQRENGTLFTHKCVTLFLVNDNPSTSKFIHRSCSYNYTLFMMYVTETE